MSRKGKKKARGRRAEQRRQTARACKRAKDREHDYWKLRLVDPSKVLVRQKRPPSPVLQQPPERTEDPP